MCMLEILQLPLARLRKSSETSVFNACQGVQSRLVGRCLVVLVSPSKSRAPPAPPSPTGRQRPPTRHLLQEGLGELGASKVVGSTLSPRGSGLGAPRSPSERIAAGERARRLLDRRPRGMGQAARTPPRGLTGTMMRTPWSRARSSTPRDCPAPGTRAKSTSRGRASTPWDGWASWRAWRSIAARMALMPCSGVVVPRDRGPRSSRCRPHRGPSSSPPKAGRFLTPTNRLRSRARVPPPRARPEGFGAPSIAATCGQNQPRKSTRSRHATT